MLRPEEEVRKAKLLKELKALDARAKARAAHRGNYEFAAIKDPKSLAELQRFQRIFGRYFPAMLKDEHYTIVFHQTVMDGIFGNPIQTIHKGTFEADLKRFKRAIKVLADWPIWQTTLYTAPSAIPYSLDVLDEENVPIAAALQIYKCLLTIADVADNHNLSQVLNQLESWAREASEHVPDRRNINWEAVNAVDRLRGYWHHGTKSPAPSRALNPTSPFADYLRDAFEFFNISGDPSAAFKRWVVIDEFFRDVRIRKWK
jgi:hypothetical protein